jgi:hypothetical protein
MSYEQMMKWNRKHPRGGKRQYMGFDSSSGFTPSHAWLVEDYQPYLDKCKAEGITPMGCKEYYDYQVQNPYADILNKKE